MTAPAHQEATGDTRLAQLVDELIGRLQAGEQVDLQAFAASHPEYAEPLQEVIPALEFLTDLPKIGFCDSPSGEGSTTGHGSPTATGSLAGTLGEFRILREIGRGGMGIVYEAEQVSLRRRVALKVLPFAAVLDPKQLQRFKNEAQAAASLDHPNIVHVHSVGCERAVHFYAMQYIEGRTLAQVVDELRHSNGVVPHDERAGDGADEAVPISRLTRDLASGRLAPPDKRSSTDKPTTNFAADTPPPGVADQDTHRQPQPQASTDASIRSREFFRTVAHLGIQAAEALEHAHGMGVVHRDIKPSNLMVDAAGHLWITDFGLAMTRAETNLTMTGDVLGTLRYMSPEQAEGRHGVLDHHTDIYSLGVTLYELLTLQPAFAGDDRQKLLRDISEAEPRGPRQLNRAIPVDLETIVGKAMSKEPKARYATAQELADDLKRFLADEPIRARRPTLAARAAKWSRRHRAVVWSAIAILLIAVAALAASTVLVAGAYESERDQRQLVEKQKRLADKQKELFEQQWKKTKQNLYLAHMRLAEQDWRAGQTSRLHELLDAHLPQPNLPDFRGWEWYFFLAQCHGDVLTMRGHHAVVSAVDWSPDGKRLASASEDGTLKIWNAATGKEILTLRGHDAQVYSVAWSPDGRCIASGGRSGEIKIWDANCGETILAMYHELGWVGSVAWSPDGKRLATAIKTGGRHPVRIWDTATGRQIRSFTQPAQRVFSVEWSPDGRRLACGNEGGTIDVWDCLTGETVLTLRTGAVNALSISWSPDGESIATADNDMQGMITIWDASTGEQRSTLSGHAGRITSIAWSQHGDQLASAGEDQTVRIWNTKSREGVLAFRGHLGPVTSVRWSPDGGRLVSASADRTVRIWDAQREQVGRTLSGHQGQVYEVAWSPDSRYVAAHGVDRPAARDMVRIWDARSGREVLPAQSVDGRNRDVPFAWSPGNPNRQCLLALCADSEVRILDPSASREVLTLTGHEDIVESVAWSPNGRRVATGGRDETIRVWDAANGRQMRAISAHSGSVLSVAWAPDNRHLAALTGEILWDEKVWNTALVVWNADTGEKAFTSPFNEHQPVWEPWSPDGRYLSSNSHIGGQQILCVGSWKEIDLPKRPALGRASWSPDGRLLASPGHGHQNNVPVFLIYDTSTWQIRFTLRGHSGLTFASSWSPEGRRLATASGDGTIKIWSARSGQEILTLREHRGAHRCAVWSPNGERLASASNDGTVKIFDASPGFRFAASPAYRADRAYRLATLGQFDEAISILRNLATEFPDVDSYHSQLADAYASRGRDYSNGGELDKAIADFTEVIRLNPQDVKAYVDRGLAYREKSNLEKAIAEYDEAIRINPEFAWAYANRGNAHLATGESSKAVADYTKAIGLGEWGSTVDEFSKAIELDASAVVWYQRALARLGAGDVAGYGNDCRRMLAHFAGSEEPETIYWIAWTCTLAPDAVPDLSKAVTLAFKAAESKPDWAASALGATLYRAGQVEEAVHYLSKVDRRGTYVWWFLAMAHHRLGHHDEARKWFDKALERTEKKAREHHDDAGGTLLWNMRLTAELLRLEAVELLSATEKDEQPQPSEGGGQGDEQ